MQRADSFLADDFCREKPLGLISDLVFRKIRLALGQMAEDFVHQRVTPRSLQGGDRDDGGKVSFFTETIDQRQQLRLGNSIDFIQNKDGLSSIALSLLDQHAFPIFVYAGALPIYHT